MQCLIFARVFFVDGEKRAALEALKLREALLDGGEGQRHVRRLLKLALPFA